jgi:hypothetical protein
MAYADVEMAKAKATATNLIIFFFSVKLFSRLADLVMALSRVAIFDSHQH